ncbi:MAG TPA: S8 family serine peptidase [Candidatus Acidoferrales bacterium]|nr:S8 family serine peptidase [Candidatus Acidoferrales bacterium]
MKNVFTFAVALAAVFSVAACGSRSSVPPMPEVESRALSDAIVTTGGQPVCSDPRPHYANCFAVLVQAPQSSGGVTPFAKATPLIYGYHPADLQKAYNLDANHGKGNLVAIVDAFGDPNLAADLSYYRKAFGLPTCTTANHCFRIVDENGGTSYPSPNPGWAVEQSLDVDMVSANCPRCDILMVQAASNGFGDLAAAVDEAASLGAVAISNSYGAAEFDDTTLEAAYDHPNIAITVSAGDGGYGVYTPASFPSVIAVGGTTLLPVPNARGYNESVWPGTGSGCSAYYAKPAWQLDPDCPTRMVADVAYDADPQSAVAFYDSYPNTTQTASGWGEVGGTSIGAPAIAAIFAQRSHPAGNASSLYAANAPLFGITSGTNSATGCAFAYFCTGEVGYDGPGGNGSPDGDGAF